MPPKEHLTFASKTPAFLRRLRGEIPSDSTGSPPDPDRHATPQVRARRPRDPADTGDGPVYIDEETGQTLAQGEVDELKKVTESANDPAKEQATAASGEADESAERKKAAAKATVHVGAVRRKREIPLVVGDDSAGAEHDEQGEHAKVEHGSLGAGKKSALTNSKVGKKVKKVKLSFDDEGL